MDLFVMIVILLSALLHASWHAVLKANSDRFLTYSVMNIVAMLFGFILLHYAGPPKNYAWDWIAASAFLHLIYKIFLIKAYTYGDLSKVFPLSRGLAPLLIALVSFTLLKETASFPQIILIVGVMIGLFLVVFEKLDFSSNKKMFLFAGISGLITASYTIVDGMGARAAGNPFWFVAWIYILDGTIFPLYAVLYRRQDFFSYLRSGWSSALLGGFFSIASYGAIVWALNNATMAGVAVLRETSLIFAAILGSVFLKEKFGFQRLIAILTITGSIIFSALYK